MFLAPHHRLGPYELLLPVAYGGTAVVWAARRTGTHRFQKLLAVKTIQPALAGEQRYERMFLREALLASRIRHPNVVEIHDLGEIDGIPYIVMEWIEGESLSVVLDAAQKEGGVPLPIAVHVVMQICRGLHAAHELRDEANNPLELVHRDVSPSNVLLTYDGGVKLADFGIAIASSQWATMSNSGELRGKVAYFSPEQLNGETVDRRSDIFALGALLYLLITGVHPFEAPSAGLTLRKISSGALAARPRERVPNCPEDLEQVVLRALEHDRALRFRTAQEMLDALRNAVQAELRGSDDDVGSYVRQLLARLRDERRHAIQQAMRATDDDTTDCEFLEVDVRRPAQQYSFPQTRLARRFLLPTIGVVAFGAVLALSLTASLNGRAPDTPRGKARVAPAAAAKSAALPNGTALVMTEATALDEEAGHAKPLISTTKQRGTNKTPESDAAASGKQRSSQGRSNGLPRVPPILSPGF